MALEEKFKTWIKTLDELKNSQKSIPYYCRFYILAQTYIQRIHSDIDNTIVIETKEYQDLELHTKSINKDWNVDLPTDPIKLWVLSGMLINSINEGSQKPKLVLQGQGGPYTELDELDYDEIPGHKKH